MRNRIMITAVLALLVACPAFGQALAEGAMVHAGAAGATAKAGSALGNALSRTTGQIGQHVQTVTHPVLGSGTVQHVPATNQITSTTNPSSSSSASGSMITSIRGARRTCATTATGASTPANSPPSGSTQQAQGCKAPTTSVSQSKSVMNVTLPQ